MKETYKEHKSIGINSILVCDYQLIAECLILGLSGYVTEMKVELYILYYHLNASKAQL